MWTLPVLLLAVTILLSIPLSRYFAWIMDGRYKAPPPAPARRLRPPPRSKLLTPHSAARARCTASAHLPRFRALALLGRRRPQPVDAVVMPASEKPAQQQTRAPQDHHFLAPTQPLTL
jgi:hypothetical protein